MIDSPRHPSEALDVVSVLANGLRLVLVDLPHVHSACCALMVRTGPRFERPDENGISHLVEHLIFRGTARHPASLDFHAAIEALGGEINGMTQRDATTIHVTVPPRHLESALDLLGEVCTEPLLGGLEVERDVVLEEIGDCLDADGNDLDLDSLSRRILWPNASMFLPVAGDVDLVETFTERECRRWFEKTFVTENAVLVVAGPIDEQVRAWANRAFGNMPRGPKLIDPPAPRPEPAPVIHVQATDDAQVSMLLTFPAPHENHPDFGRLMLLRRILDDGFSSRLRQAICEERGLAYSLSVGVDAYRDAGALDVEISCAPKKLVAVLEQTLASLAELQRTPVGEAELSRAKTRHRAEMEFALDDPHEMVCWHGASALMELEVDNATRQREVSEAGAEELRALAQRLFSIDRALLTLVGPADERVVSRLERLIGRPPQSTVWLGHEDEDDPVDAADSSRPILVAG